MKRPVDWIMRLARKKSTVDYIAESPEGKVFLTWLRNEVLHVDMNPVDADGNPFKTTANATRVQIWNEIQAELSLDVQQVIDSAVKFEEQQQGVETAARRLGLTPEQEGEAA